MSERKALELEIYKVEYDARTPKAMRKGGGGGRGVTEVAKTS